MSQGVCHREDDSGQTRQWSHRRTSSWKSEGNAEEAAYVFPTRPRHRTKMILAWASKDREGVYAQLERGKVKFLWQTQHVDARKDKQRRVAAPWDTGQEDNENVGAVTVQKHGDSQATRHDFFCGGFEGVRTRGWRDPNWTVES